MRKSVAQDLSQEILSFIFKHLDMETCLSAGLTCRKWRRTITSTRWLWRGVILKWKWYDRGCGTHLLAKATQPTLQDKLAIYQRHSANTISNINIFYINDIGEYDKIGVENTSDEEVSTTEHIFEEGLMRARPTDSRLQDVLRSMHPNLESFSFSVHSFFKLRYDDQLLLDAFVTRHTNLKHLDLESAPPLFADLQDILSLLPHLKSLRINCRPSERWDTQRIRDRSILDRNSFVHPLETLLLRNTTTCINTASLADLKDLHFDGSVIYFIDPKSIESQQSTTYVNFPKLRKLWIKNTRVRLDGQDIPINAPELTELNVLECNLSVLAFSMPTFKNLSSLRLLPAKNTPGASTLLVEFLQYVADSSPSITKFYWNSVPNVQDSIVLDQIRKWPNLHTLSFYESDITDAMIHGLDDAAPRLQTLNVSQCNKITVTALAGLVKKRLDPQKFKIEKLEMHGVVDFVGADFLRAHVPVI